MHRAYVPDLILSSGAWLKSVQYNAELDSTVQVKIMASKTVLGSTVCVKNTVPGSKARAIHQYLLIKKSIAQDPKVKLGVKI